ncbi:hypothetical protein ACF3NG_02935 [Aerococcaceae bacterium WGS1372]
MVNTEEFKNDLYLVSILAKVKLADKIDDIYHKRGTSGATTFLAACYNEASRQSIMSIDGERKEIIMKVTHRDQLELFINHVVNKYPSKDEGENFLYVTPLAGLQGLEGYGDISDNESFKKATLPNKVRYNLVTTICNHGEGEDYIDATQSLDVLQHILIHGHGSSRLSQNFQGRYIQPEKDIVMQIVPSDKLHELKEFTDAYEAIQLSEAGAIAFTRDVVYLHRF